MWQADLTGPTPLYLTGVLDNSPADNPVSGGVLALDAATGPLYLSGGEIYQGAVTTSGGDDLVATSAGGTLNGVTLDGTLDMPQSQSNSGDDVAYVVNGLTLNGTIELGDDGPANLYFGAAGDNVAQTIGGTGVIQFNPYGSPATLYNDSNETLTIGPGITIYGGWASSITGTTAGIDNEGTVEENTNLTDYGVMTIDTTGWVNNGVMEAGDGGNLDLYGSWTNEGAINVAAGSTIGLGSPVDIAPSNPAAAGYSWSNQGTLAIAAGDTVNLGGVFTTDAFDALVAAGQIGPAETVNLTGTLDNSPADNLVSGGVLRLDAATAPLYLSGGEIYEGTITTSGGDDLVGLANPNAANAVILAGVTLDGTLDLGQQSSTATVNDGLVLNGVILLGLPPLNNYIASALVFGSDNVAQTVSGDGSIRFGQDYGTADYLENDSQASLTFGPNITIEASLNSYMETIYSGQIIDQGTIEEDAAVPSVAPASNVLTINGDWVNSGTIEAGNGVTLDLYGNWSNDGTITVAATCTANLGSPVNISPTNSSAAGYDWSNRGTLSIGNECHGQLGRRFHRRYLRNFHCKSRGPRREPRRRHGQFDRDVGQQRP